MLYRMLKHNIKIICSILPSICEEIEGKVQKASEEELKGTLGYTEVQFVSVTDKSLIVSGV
jgi:hypothetical protein